MGRYARLAVAALALTLSGCDYWPPKLQQLELLWGMPAGPALLVCRGDFAQFANGFMVTRPMELHFIIDWATSAVTPTDGGSPTRLSALNSAALSFEVQYGGYRAAYHLDRVTATFSQRPNLGGVFFGRCEMKPYITKF